jgi:hypothetical protein
MNRNAIACAVAALCGLSACSTTYEPRVGDTPASGPTSANTALHAAPGDPSRVTVVPPATVTVPPATVAVAPAPVGVIVAPVAPVPATAPLTAYRPGWGAIESIALVRYATPVPSATAGGSSPVAASYRIGVRMDDGSTQMFDQDQRNFLVGDRVQITPQGQVMR